jgi:acetylglutamate kinase
MLGYQIVVVHGGGPQIDKALKKLNIEAKFIDGLRYTDLATMQVVEWVLAGEVNPELVGNINQFIKIGDKLALGLSGKQANLLQASIENPQIGFVGKIEQVNQAVLKNLLEQYIPVIAPIACLSGKQQSLNVNADLVAASIAKALNADKLIMMSNIPGVLNKQGELIEHIAPLTMEDLLSDGTISGGMIPKIQSSLDAAVYGVKAVQIIDGRIEHALTKVLLGDMQGTTITAN